MTGDTKECPFCAETIKAAAKKCKHCGEFLDDHTRESVSGDQVGGDKISAGDLSDVKGAAIGRGSQAASTGHVGRDFIQAAGDVKLGKELRDEQYQIALDWGRQKRMREFDLSGRDLAGLNFAFADMRKSNLSSANLNDAQLYKADLSGANLEEANLFGANLAEANLFGANLFGANLQWANLQAANLQAAKLQWANLLEVNLLETRLLGANLEGANLFESNLQGVLYDTETIWPVYFDPEAAGAILVDADGNPIEGINEEE